MKLESQFFSLQKVNLLARKVHYLHSKFSFCMSIFLRDSQIFSVTCGCVQKLNICKIELENLRFSSPVIDFCIHVLVWRQYFFNNPETDFIVQTAIRLKQKKVIVKRLSSLCLACLTSPLCFCIIDSLKISYQK